MTIEKFEEMILSELKWNSIKEIPNFPIKDFNSLVESIQHTKTFSLGIDYTMAGQIAPIFCKKGAKLIFLLLPLFPLILIPLLIIVLSFLLNNYWLLIGIVLNFLAFLFSNPYNPRKDFWNIIAILLCLVGVYSFIQNQDTLFYLILSFVIPFFLNVFWNRNSWNKIKEVVLNSERIFIYFYQQDKLYLMDNSNNQSYSFIKNNYDFKID